MLLLIPLLSLLLTMPLPLLLMLLVSLPLTLLGRVYGKFCLLFFFFGLTI